MGQTRRAAEEKTAFLCAAETMYEELGMRNSWRQQHPETSFDGHAGKPLWSRSWRLSRQVWNPKTRQPARGSPRRAADAFLTSLSLSESSLQRLRTEAGLVVAEQTKAAQSLVRLPQCEADEEAVVLREIDGQGGDACLDRRAGGDG